MTEPRIITTELPEETEESPKSDVPALQIETLINAKGVVDEHLPGLWPTIEAVLAAEATLRIDGIKDPASMILAGSPSSEKGTALSSIKDHKSTYWSDKFTPAAFVSQAANKSKEQLAEIDLLPRIKDKTLVVPEMSPIFSARTDVLKMNIATLTRIFDGEGYWVDAGTGGGRGYRGEHRFTFVGATTHPPSSLWKVLGKLGNRLCFWVMLDNPDKDDPEGFARELREDEVYKEKLRRVREAVHRVIDEMDAVAPVTWTRKADSQEVVQKITALAQLSGRLRGVIPSVRGDDGKYNRGFPQVERLQRFGTLLYNLARGRALVNGRRNIDESDLEMVRHIALSSCEYGRYRLMQLLIGEGGEASTGIIEDVLGCSKAHARSIMVDLSILGVTREEDRARAVGGSLKMLVLRPRFRALLVG